MTPTLTPKVAAVLGKPLPESLTAALARKEALIKSLGGSWRIPRTKRSLGRELQDADFELERLAKERGMTGAELALLCLADTALQKSHATLAKATPVTKEQHWAAYRALTEPHEKNSYFERFKSVMDK